MPPQGAPRPPSFHAGRQASPPGKSAPQGATPPQRQAVRAPSADTRLARARAHRASQLGDYTALKQWQHAHALHPASSRPIANPRAYTIRWPTTKPWDPDPKRQQARFILQEVERYRAMNPGQPPDMRPLMYAGAMLGVRGGGHHMKRQEALQLLQRLREEASSTAPGAPTTEPDILRMVVAGFIAVCGPEGSDAAAMLIATRNLEDEDAEVKAQWTAMAQGVGIGMAWKGTDAVAQQAQALEATGKYINTDLLREMKAGDACGLGWLLRLEDALPHLQGASAPDLPMEKAKALILLREFQRPRDGPGPKNPQPAPGSNSPPARLAAAHANPQNPDDDDDDSDEGVQYTLNPLQAASLTSHQPLGPAAMPSATPLSVRGSARPRASDSDSDTDA